LLTPGWRSKGKLSSDHRRGGDGLAFGAREFGVEHLGHAVQAQLVDQGAQLVTHRLAPRC
jgi:hypothetical protein